MAITNFKDEIEDLVGSIPASITDSGEKIFMNGIKDTIRRISIVNPSLLPLFSAESSFIPDVGHSLSGFNKIISVTANDGDSDVNCIPIAPIYKTRVQKDSGSLYEASLSSPVFYVIDGSLYTAPQYDYAVTISAETLKVSLAAGGALYVAADGVPAVGDVFKVSDTTDFTGDELETAKGTAPAANDYFRITGVVTDPPTVEYLGASKVSEVVAGAITSYSTSTSSIASFPSEFYPMPITYTAAVIVGEQIAGFSKSTLSLTATPTIADVTISATAPTSPTLVAVTTGVATIAATDLSKLTPPTYTKPTATFDVTQFETFLETNEDVELAQLQLGRLQKELGEYQSDIQNELNEFNKENVDFQADVQALILATQVDMQEAQKEGELASQADMKANSDLLAKYAAEVQAYQVTVNAEVQEFQQNVSKDVSIWTTARQTELQEFANLLQQDALELQMLKDNYGILQGRYESLFVPYSGGK